MPQIDGFNWLKIIRLGGGKSGLANFIAFLFVGIVVTVIMVVDAYLVCRVNSVSC